MKKSIALFLCIALTVSLLAACTGGGGGGTDPAAVGDKDTLIYVQNSMNSLDPYAISTVNDMVIRSQMFEPLVNFRDNKEEMRMAESYEVSEDGLTYTFKIRPGVKFHNGAEMTIDDVVYSWETAIASPFMSSYTEMIDSVEAVDDTTFAIHLKYPYGPFIAASVYNVVIVNKEQYSGAANPAQEPCGTGAYKLVSYDEGHKLILEAFDDYFRGAPSIKNLEFNVITDPASALMALESNEANIVEVPTSDWDRISNSGTYGTDTITANGLHFLAFNLFLEGDHPFKDARVRQACAYAINRQDTILMALNGLAKEAKTVGNPDYMFGATEENCIIYEHDVDKAKELLAEAGYPDGVDLGEISTTADEADVVNSIKGFLAEAGINVTINIQDNTAFFDDWDNINYNMLVSGLTLGADFNDWSYAFTTGGWLNQFGYQNEALDKKFQDAVSTPDTNERLALYSEINAELQENMPIVPIYFKTKYYAYTKGLKFPYSVTRFEFFDAAWE